MPKKPDEPYSDEEIARRRDEALLRALSTPPKRHSEMKVGKPHRTAKERPVSKWSVHKGKSPD